MFRQVLRRKALGIEALAVQRDAILKGRYPELASKLEALAKLRGEICDLALSGPKKGSGTFHKDELNQKLRARDVLEGQLARQIPELDISLKLKTFDIQDVQTLLPDNAALVEVIRFPLANFDVPLWQWRENQPEEHYLAFVITKDKGMVPRMVDLGVANKIDVLIANFRKHVMRRPGLADVGMATLRRIFRRPSAEVLQGQAFTKLIFEPLELNNQNYPNLFFAPDGNLCLLPLQTLPRHDGCRLIDFFEITYLNVGRDLLRIRELDLSDLSIPYVVADPDFDLRSLSPHHNENESSVELHRAIHRSSLRFRRLPGTKQEGERVAAILSAQLLTGGNALEATIKGLRSPHILHIASHGFFLPNVDLSSTNVGRLSPSSFGMENPLLRSGLALAGANTWLRGGNPEPVNEMRHARLKD